MSLIKGCPEIESEEDFYEKADDYWKSIPSTIDGMLGGFSRISEVDIHGSKLFLKHFIKVLFNRREKVLNKFLYFRVHLPLLKQEELLIVELVLEEYLKVFYYQVLKPSIL